MGVESEPLQTVSPSQIIRIRGPLLAYHYSVSTMCSFLRCVAMDRRLLQVLQLSAGHFTNVSVMIVFGMRTRSQVTRQLCK